MERQNIMERFVLTLLGLVLIFNCSCKKPIALNDDILANSLKKENLTGKVKELALYKSTVTNSENLTKDTSFIFRRMQFNEFGKVFNEEYYDEFGKIVESTISEFNDINLLANRKVKNYKTSTNIVDSLEYDNENQQITYIAKVDNDRNHDVTKITTFDKFLNIIKTVTIQFNDTSTTIFNCKYDNQGKVIYKTQTILNRPSSNEYFYEYKYNANGDLIEFILKTKENEKMKNIAEYDNDLIRKSSQFIDGMLKEEKLYDKHSNPISVKHFNKNELEKELMFEYKYDIHNNWNEKKEFMKDYSKKAVEFLPTIIETREIKYYE